MRFEPIDAVWDEFCRRVEGRPVERSPGLWPAFQVVSGAWIITMDLCIGSRSRPQVRFRAPFVNWSGFRFVLHRRGEWGRTFSRWTQREEDRGWPVSWVDFGVLCDDEDALRHFLEPPALTRRLNRLQPLQMGIRDHEGWSGPDYPPGVDLLFLQGDEGLQDADRLEHYYHLFTELTAAVDLFHSPGRDEEASLLLLLGAPSGRISQDGVDLWDGDVLRIWAADQLARRGSARAVPPLLRLLRDRKPLLRLEALRALRTLRASECVPAVLPLLADERPGAAGTVAEAAARTLRWLGAGAWVDRFCDVLAGRADGLLLEGTYRKELVETLVLALESANPERTLNAARALVALHAVDAVPALRQAMQRQRHYMLEKELQPLIRSLESDATLPRPAVAPPEAGLGLPIPSSPAEPCSDLLPRPSEGAGDRGTGA